MAIGDVYQLGVNQSLYGVTMANVYHFEQLTDISTATSVEASLMEAWNEVMRPLQQAMSSNSWIQNCLTARRVRPTGGVRFVNTSFFLGSLPGAAFAPNTAALGRLYSDTVGPRGRSRHWFAGMEIGGSDKGRLTVATEALVNAFLDRIIQVIKWTADNAEFIIRVISTVDLVIRAVQSHSLQPQIFKLKPRVARIC